MATKIPKWLVQSLFKIGQNLPMSTLKLFNFEAMFIKDWVCLQCFQQDALEFEIIAFTKSEMTSKMVAIALKCNSFCLKF